MGNPVVGFDNRGRGGGHREIELGQLTDRHRSRFSHGLREFSETFDKTRNLEEGNANRAGARKELIGGLIRKGRVQEKGLTADPARTSPGLRDMVGDEGVVYKTRHLGGSDGIGGLTDSIGYGHGAHAQWIEKALILRFPDIARAHILFSPLPCRHCIRSRDLIPASSSAATILPYTRPRDPDENPHLQAGGRCSATCADAGGHRIPR